MSRFVRLFLITFLFSETFQAVQSETVQAIQSDFVAFQSVQSGKYVRAGVPPDSHLAAVSLHIRGWETFVLIRLGGNRVALRSALSGKFVRAGVGPDSHLAAVSPALGAWETFTLTNLGGNKVALHSANSGKTVRAGVGPKSHLAALSSHTGSWETFTMLSVPGGHRFAHPEKPHVWWTNPSLPMSVPELLYNTNAVIQLPVLVVLLQFNDLGPEAGHTPAYFADMVFGRNRANGHPSLAEIYRENSNGRLLLVPATVGDKHGAADGIVGWVNARNRAGCCRNANNDPVGVTQTVCTQPGHKWIAGSSAYFDCYIEQKRAEGIVAADPFFDFSRYDTRPRDNVIKSNELVVLVINAAREFGGNARVTDPPRVKVEGGKFEIHQLITGVTEQTHAGLLAHEFGHQVFGLGDLYEATPNTHVVDGYLFKNTDWHPPDPMRYSLMGGNNPASIMSHLDPWAKIHLGFVNPMVVSHDGTYTLFDIETERNFAQQITHPEAMIIYDPLRPDPFKEYFILENRNREYRDPSNTVVLDRGLAVWLINENESNLRKAIRLVRRGGHWAGELQSLWDGVNRTEGYDLTPTSKPRNTHWASGSDSQIEIYDISPAGPAMTFKIRTRQVR